MTPEQEYFRLRWRIARFVIDSLLMVLIYWCGMRYGERRALCESHNGTFDPPQASFMAICRATPGRAWKP